MAEKPTRPRDPNELAYRIMLESTGQVPKTNPPEVKAKNPAAVELGRLGGLKGGAARAANAGVEEEVDPLAGGELVSVVLPCSAALATHGEGPRAAFTERGVERVEARRVRAGAHRGTKGQAATPMIRPSIQPVHLFEQITRAHAPRTSATWMGKPAARLATTGPDGSGAPHARRPCGGTEWLGAHPPAGCGTGCACTGCA